MRSSYVTIILGQLYHSSSKSKIDLEILAVTYLSVPSMYPTLLLSLILLTPQDRFLIVLGGLVGRSLKAPWVMEYV
jgi:hypothetical protein